MRLLLGGGFEIAQPSLMMEERFGIEGDREPPDLDIYDRVDHQGVKAVGKADAVDKFISILKKFLNDVILRKGTIPAGGIYKGLVKEIEVDFTFRDANLEMRLVSIGVTKG
jgi:hypothetical protein